MSKKNNNDNFFNGKMAGGKDGFYSDGWASDGWASDGWSGDGWWSDGKSELSIDDLDGIAGGQDIHVRQADQKQQVNQQMQMQMQNEGRPFQNNAPGAGVIFDEKPDDRFIP